MAIQCFECDRKASHNHHVIPESLGGIRTIPLCERCHGVIHGLNLEHHGELIKLGMQRAMATGMRPGRRIDTELYDRVSFLIFTGYSIPETALVVGVHPTTVRKILKFNENKYRAEQLQFPFEYEKIPDCETGSGGDRCDPEDGTPVGGSAEIPVAADCPEPDTDTAAGVAGVSFDFHSLQD
jgi:hypothetical protein